MQIAARPPTTPPAMAPMGVELDLPDSEMVVPLVVDTVEPRWKISFVSVELTVEDRSPALGGTFCLKKSLTVSSFHFTDEVTLCRHKHRN